MQISERRLTYRLGFIMLAVWMFLSIGADAQFRNKGKLKVRKVYPDFYATIDNIKSGSNISISQIAKGRLLSGNPKVNVVSYKVILVTKNTLYEKTIKGDRFSDELVRMLYLTKPNTKISFEKIMVQATTERVQEIAPISYYVFKGDVPIREETLIEN